MMKKGQCCDGGNSCAALSVVLRTGESWVLPWHRFLHARLSPGSLTLVFAEHRVEIAGRNLGPMFDQYVADMKLAAIRELPAEYAVIAEPNSAYIETIVVVERE